MKYAKMIDMLIFSFLTFWWQTGNTVLII